MGEIKSNHSCLYLKLFQKTGKKRLRIRDESVYPPAKRLKLCEPQRSVTLSLNNNVTPCTPFLAPYSWPQLLRTHTSVPSISRTPFLLVSHSQTKFSKESPLLGVLVKPNAVNLPRSFSDCSQNPSKPLRIVSSMTSSEMLDTRVSLPMLTYLWPLVPYKLPPQGSSPSAQEITVNSKKRSRDEDEVTRKRRMKYKMEELLCLHTPGLCNKKKVVRERSFPLSVYYLLEKLDDINCNSSDDLDNDMEVNDRYSHSHLDLEYDDEVKEDPCIGSPAFLCVSRSGVCVKQHTQEFLS